jgi:hypothetical protein
MRRLWRLSPCKVAGTVELELRHWETLFWHTHDPFQNFHHINRPLADRVGLVPLPTTNEHRTFDSDKIKWPRSILLIYDKITFAKLVIS